MPSRKSNQTTARTLIHVKAVALLLATFSVALLSSIPAHADPRNPTGQYPDSKLEGKPASVAQQGKPENAPETSVEQVEQWVETQITAVKHYLFGDESGPATKQAVRQKPVEPLVGKKAPRGLASEEGTQPAAQGPRQAAVQPDQSAGQTAAVVQPPPSQPQQAAPTKMEGLAAKPSGVMAYEIKDAKRIPRLQLEKESPISRTDFRIDSRLEKIFLDHSPHILLSPKVISAGELQHMLKKRTPQAAKMVEVGKVPVFTHGKVERASYDKYTMRLRAETPLALKKYTSLSKDERMFLSGLLLYQQGEQCPAALGLFHKLAKLKGWEAESNYYLAMCSKQVSLMSDFYERAQRVLLTQDVYYSRKILGELGFEVPYELTEGFGDVMIKAVKNKKISENLKPEVMANVAFLVADLGVATGQYKMALEWASKVPPTHPKFLKSRFLMALADYEAGSKTEALAIEDKIVNDKTLDKSNQEFQALVALNAGRMYFQGKNFHMAHENFQKVYKDHPLWLQSLTEMGWAQLMDGDYEGAIGNMYSVQSPYFSAVYKPESYVIRTIGYLNLCQYGDAYRTLSQLEHDYRPMLTEMDEFISGNEKKKFSYYDMVKIFVKLNLKSTEDHKIPIEISGLPSSVVREMARHRDFINLQKSLNRLVDERSGYSKVDGKVDASLKKAQGEVTTLRASAEVIRHKIKAAIVKNDAVEKDAENKHLDQTLEQLNDAFFKVDLFMAAKAGIEEYRRDVAGVADERIASVRNRVEGALRKRLSAMRKELARYLDNNEFLRYEAFAGSGENLRFQVAGGELAKRVPASILPKSKSMQWEFDGEYWEDEIGHYRSGLKNNCPGQGQGQSQANLGGGSDEKQKH